MSSTVGELFRVIDLVGVFGNAILGGGAAPQQGTGAPQQGTGAAYGHGGGGQLGHRGVQDVFDDGGVPVLVEIDSSRVDRAARYQPMGWSFS